MKADLFGRFAPIIGSLSDAELAGAPSLYEKLSLAQDGALRVCYAPFDYVNPTAKLVLVGITPGTTQMLNALNKARSLLAQGQPHETILKAAKATGAFSGPMRPNLVALLDAIGIHQWLNIRSCGDLFVSSGHLVQTTSLLRNPVFVNGANYNGTPSMTKHPLLQEQLLNFFAQDIASLSDALFVPLGDKVAEALHFLSGKGFMAEDRILEGLPHPSGANAERIAYFLGRKGRGELSAKTNAEKLDEARIKLQSRVLALS